MAASHADDMQSLNRRHPSAAAGSRLFDAYGSMAALQRFKRDLNLCFSIFKRIFSGSALFQRAVAAVFQKNRRKIFHKVMGAGLLVFTNQVQRPFLRSKRALQIGG